MKQIIQNIKNGATLLEEVPAPIIRKGHLLIKTHRSLVSLGTEKMLVEFGKSNLIIKARQQPEKVKQVLDKVKTDGLITTLEAVFNKLDEPMPLGYCNAGEVIKVGEDVMGFKVGDRVASNGPHAEYVCIPTNLCAHIPDEVSYDEAAFTVIGAIGLQGIRLAQPALGETVVVIGLGLVGLITAELLIVNGCTVIGFDFDERKVALANEKGVKAFNSGKVINPVKIVEELSANIGADAVIITASTKSNEVISQAAQMSRKRGRIVLVGVVGLNINRSDFYKKELTFQVSCSYGPGRYDEDYENKGIDYPLPYVRWTEKRNFDAVLAAIATKKLNVLPLITERINLPDYRQVYDNLSKGSVASVLVYPDKRNEKNAHSLVQLKQSFPGKSNGVIGVIGAGNFTKTTLLPALKDNDIHAKYIASAGGVNANVLAKKYGFTYSTTNYKEILQDGEVDLVMITTQHHMHKKMVLEALQIGKHVFVEKPLAINQNQLNEIIIFFDGLNEQTSNLKTLTVGFNRRFSIFSKKAKQLLGHSNSSINMVATINAGFIPSNAWLHDINIGGGRIIGEACHFIDLMTFINGSKVVGVYMCALGKNPLETTDNAIITLKFENGSQGVVNYFANGNKSYSKERIEIYSQGRILILDNFKSLVGYGFKGFSSLRKKQDKGHKAQFQALIKSVKEGAEPLIPLDELINTTQASFAAIESLKSGEWITVSA